METSILGCGWLGHSLGKHLVKKGHLVKGSTTTEEKLYELEKSGINPYRVVLNPEYSGEKDFLNSDLVVINIPPPKGSGEIESFMASQLDSVLSIMRNFSVGHVIFVSSTSVFPALNREVYETDAREPEREAGRALLKAERMIMDDSSFASTIIRFGGLFGYDRIPGRFLAGKKGLKNGEAPVNLIHRDDCIEIISRIIQQDVWREVFNACADMHPTRKEFYTRAAENAGLPLPEFDESAGLTYKIVNSDKLKSTINYQFHYPDPMEAI